MADILFPIRAAPDIGEMDLDFCRGFFFICCYTSVKDDKSQNEISG